MPEPPAQVQPWKYLFPTPKDSGKETTTRAVGQLDIGELIVNGGQGGAPVKTVVLYDSIDEGSGAKADKHSDPE